MKFFTIISLFAIAKSVLGDNEFNSVADAVAAGAEVAIECPNWGSVACNPEDDNVKDSLPLEARRALRSQWIGL